VLPESELIDDCLERDSSDAAVPSAGDVRDLMWRHVGVLRTREGLELAVSRLRTWAWATNRLNGGTHDPDARRLENLVTVGGLIAQAALRRTESRGAHFRTDFPVRDDLHWKKRVAQRRHDH
jgi:L-aspartate oxidase